MQGIQMSATLVWTINRTGDGPFLAFKNLGSDLNSNNPKTANDALISMSSAIVRSCIANSTIEEMMRDRKGIQNKIKEEMFQVVKGWGVWLETMEVTEVKISSSSLFKDLQTSYRETVRRDAEFCQMKFQQEIAEVETKAEAEKAEFKRGIDEQKRVIDNDYN
jgi:flotillin